MIDDQALVILGLVLFTVGACGLLVCVAVGVFRVWRWLFYPLWWHKGYKMVKREWSLSLDRPRRREYVAYSYSYVYRGNYNALTKMVDMELLSRGDSDNMEHDPYLGAAVSAWRRKYKK